MKALQNIWKRPFLPLVFLLLLAFGLRLYRLDSQSLWWDELKTVQRAGMSFPELMTDLAGHRAHLPLYFALMQGWHWLGSSAFVMRFFSVLWGVLGCAAVFQLGRQIASTRVGLIASFLLAISPFHFWYSQEARMYSLLPTLLILANYLTVLNLQQNKWRYWLLYALLITIAAATHYFAFFVIMAHYVFFVLHYRQLRQQTRRWFMMIILTGIMLLPLGLFILSGRGDSIVTVPQWINNIHWYDPLLTLWNFSIGPGIGLEQWVGYVGTALFLVSFITAVQLGRRLKANNSTERPFPSRTLITRLLLYWFALPLGLVFLVSINWPFLPDNPFSLYLDRYLIIALPPFLLLVAWGVEQLSKNKRWIQPVFIILALLLNGNSIWQLSHNPAHFRNDWRNAFQLVQEGQEDTVVVIGQQDIILPLGYYGGDQITYIQIPPPDDGSMSPAYIASMKQQMATAVQKSAHVWLIEAFYNHDTHQFPDKRYQLAADETQSMAQIWLNANNFVTLAQHNLPGLRLTHYDLETAIHEQ